MKGRRMRIKICGLREADNIAKVAALHPDYMGFIFYPLSPRYCSDLKPDVIKALPDYIMTVAVTVDMDKTGIMSLIEKYGFRAVQLHGHESPELCKYLKDRGIFVIKALSVNDKMSIKDIGEYNDNVDLFVFDTASSCKGGSGKKFDWELLRDADINTDFLLSGGIGPEDRESLAEFSHSHFIGIDLNSRFETTPGVKDIELLKEFML